MFRIEASKKWCGSDLWTEIFCRDLYIITCGFQWVAVKLHASCCGYVCGSRFMMNCSSRNNSIQGLFWSIFWPIHANKYRHVIPRNVHYLEKKTCVCVCTIYGFQSSILWRYPNGCIFCLTLEASLCYHQLSSTIINYRHYDHHFHHYHYQSLSSLYISLASLLCVTASRFVTSTHSEWMRMAIRPGASTGQPTGWVETNALLFWMCFDIPSGKLTVCYWKWP